MSWRYAPPAGGGEANPLNSESACANVKSSFLDVALMPFGVVTVSCTVPTGAAGETARSPVFGSP